MVSDRAHRVGRGLPALLCGVALLGGIGCSAPALYQWGEYEALLYEMYLQPSETEPTAHIERLNRQIEATTAQQERVPPGVHAHLGHMYRITGETSRARDHFQTEKRLYPESATLMDRALARLEPETEGS